MRRIAYTINEPEPAWSELAQSPPSISIGYRIAIRGAILTDLRRMLDEVHDIVAMTSHPSLKEQAEEQSTR